MRIHRLGSRLSLPLGVLLCGGVGIQAAARIAPTLSERSAGGGTQPDALPEAAAGSEFDWCVAPGQTLILSTSQATLTGGPHCANTTTKTVLGGLVDVRHMWIQEGAVVRVQGPNPLVIHASGSVRIDGTLDLSGSDSLGVVTLNSTNIPEVGAPGQAGGGMGGSGSPLVAASSPKGGSGAGAFQAAGLGGAGGETGWSNVGSLLDQRRGAGGGGGVLGPNQAQSFGAPANFGTWDQSFIGLDVEPGFSNLTAGSQGALTGAAGPLGGRTGQSPFQDGNPHNDFYGEAIDLQTGALIVGELQQPWAGSGGGGGGDASFVGNGGTWPAVPFSPFGDEKGGSGGGGGGSLQLLAQGDIIFGARGLIRARGGSGGGGENTSFVNRVGGGGGGGSGGHVILQAAGVIDLRLSLGQGGVTGSLLGGILATGGQGGGGRNDLGGATLSPNGKQDTLPSQDACPPALTGSAYPSSGPNACRGQVDGAGGDGGPGLVQLHTANGLDPQNPSILLPAGATISDLVKPRPVCSRAACNLLPSLP